MDLLELLDGYLKNSSAAYETSKAAGRRERNSSRSRVPSPMLFQILVTVTIRLSPMSLSVQGIPKQDWRAPCRVYMAIWTASHYDPDSICWPFDVPVTVLGKFGSHALLR